MKDNVFIFIIFVFLLSSAILLRMNNDICNIVGIAIAIIGVILIFFMLKKNKKR